MAQKTTRRLRTGDEIIVETPDEILATLDADGTLEGLPFMPEMVEACGKRFRVARRVEKTCVEGYGPMRRFAARDVVLLDGQRCSGEGHDGCNRGCMLFWKEAWLRRPRAQESAPHVDESQKQQLLNRLTVKKDSSHYFCQSTQLGSATTTFPGKQTPWMVVVALREIWYGSRSASEVVGLALHWIRLSLHRWRHGGDRLLRGPNQRTPTEVLDLAPGERVEIKSPPEILATLDGNQMNRGLRIAYAMTQNCGNRFEVERRVERIISETTGEMREVHNTVALRGVECHCYYQCLGCPRGDLSYWREIWLKRVRGA